MLHAHTFVGRRLPPPPADCPADPLTPARYVGLRRKAANLTIDQVAERIARKATQQSEVRALLRLLETPGTVARDRDTIELLRVALPIDPDVYFQLATEPADRHPSICHGCGCSEYDPCGDEALGACAWAARDLCTRCSGGDLM
jgi:hypothetical protein